MTTTTKTQGALQLRRAVLPTTRRFLLSCLLLCLLCLCPQSSHGLSLFRRLYRPVKNRLWPNSLSDPAFPETPLPPGPLGCPFGPGYNPRASTPTFGPGWTFWRVARRLRNRQDRNIFKLFVRPHHRGVAVLTGYNTTQAVLSQEFQGPIVPQLVPFTAKIVGPHSLRCAADKGRHTQLRQLVGQAVQAPAVRQTVGQLEALALRAIRQNHHAAVQNHNHHNNNNNNNNNTATTVLQMEDICTDFALDVAWRLIIGLLEKDASEAAIFRTQVRQWLQGIYTKDDDSWQSARAFLVDQIQAQLDRLEAEPDDDTSTTTTTTTTLRALLSARGEDGDSSSKLTHDEIIDNVLLLILAGTETSAATLTNCFLLLGLRPDAWDELVREQEALMKKQLEKQQQTESSSSCLTYDMIQHDCPYADAVVRESLRIRPTTGGSLRGVAQTLVVDGCQIPAGWGVTYDRYLTHLWDPSTRNDKHEDDYSHMDVRTGFLPERWLDPATRPGRDFIPFGVGPRYCLGKDLAMTEMKVFLAVAARTMRQCELVYPQIESQDIRWRQRAIIPVPEDGVQIRAVVKQPEAMEE